MRSEGFLFLSGGSGGGTVFVAFWGMVSQTTASVRERSRATVLCPMRCALRIGLEGVRLGEALWRCAVVIAGESLVCAALCRRRAVVIGGESGVSAALCRYYCWGERGLGVAVPL